MSVLTQDTARDYELGEVNAHRLAENVIIYEGAAVGMDTEGYARPLQAGDKFLGFCEQRAARSEGNERVRVKTQGKTKLHVANTNLTDTGKAIFAEDDHTFTLTAEKNSRIGWIYRVETTGDCVVTFEAAHE